MEWEGTQAGLASWALRQTVPGPGPGGQLCRCVRATPGPACPPCPGRQRTLPRSWGLPTECPPNTVARWRFGPVLFTSVGYAQDPQLPPGGCRGGGWGGLSPRGRRAVLRGVLHPRPTLKTGQEALPGSHSHARVKRRNSPGFVRWVPMRACAPPHTVPPQNVTRPRPLGKEQLAPEGPEPQTQGGRPHAGVAE